MSIGHHKPPVSAVFASIVTLLFLASEVAADVNALFRAAQKGDIETSRTLIADGVDVNERNMFGSFALNTAAVENNIELLQLFLNSGADVNLQNWSGDTALICATKYAGGNKQTIKLLLEAGSDITLKDEDGKTALDYAREKQQPDAVALLEKVR